MAPFTWMGGGGVKFTRIHTHEYEIENKAVYILVIKVFARSAYAGWEKRNSNRREYPIMHSLNRVTKTKQINVLPSILEELVD